MPKSPALAGAAALCCACGALADEAPLQRLAALEFPRGERIAYVERQSNRLLRKPLEQRGLMWIEPHDTLVMRVVEPRLEERRLAQGELTLLRPRRRAEGDVEAVIAAATARHTRLDPKRGAHAALAAIADLVLGRVDDLALRFTATPVESEDEHSWEIELTPIDADLRRALQSIRLYGTANGLTEVRAERGAKGWRHFRFLMPSEHRGMSP